MKNKKNTSILKCKQSKQLNRAVFSLIDLLSSVKVYHIFIYTTVKIWKNDRLKKGISISKKAK